VVVDVVQVELELHPDMVDLIGAYGGLAPDDL
jgi:hypothetical protein